MIVLKSIVDFSIVNADVNHDGIINISDALKLMRYIAKWDVDLSVSGG